MTRVLTCLAALVLLTLPLQAGSVSTARPEEVGLSAERLGRIREAVQTSTPALQRDFDNAVMQAIVE
jgi:hypothetical protein